MRWPSLIAAALLVATLAGCGAEEHGLSPALDFPQPPRAKAPLADLKADAGQLLGGGPETFDEWLKALRGHPVVVNQWASWCGPCRYEFPFLASQARKRDGKVAFLGVDSKDGRDSARSFLKRHPVPFPHFFDGDAAIARSFRGGRSWPTTAFFDASGKRVFTRQGSYASEAELAADIERYALGG